MSEKRKRGRPATGETKHRGVRVPDEIWRKAQERAEREGRSISDVIREHLREYGEDAEK